MPELITKANRGYIKEIILKICHDLGVLPGYYEQPETLQSLEVKDRGQFMTVTYRQGSFTDCFIYDKTEWERGMLA